MKHKRVSLYQPWSLHIPVQGEAANKLTNLLMPLYFREFSVWRGHEA